MKITNQDGLEVNVKVNDSDNLTYIAELRKLTAKNGVEVFLLIAEAEDDENYDDGDEVVIGVYLEDRYTAEDALTILEQDKVVIGESISAIEYLKAIDEYTTQEGAAVADMTAVEYFNA